MMRTNHLSDMRLDELSHTLKSRRIRLEYRGGRLRVRGKREAVTPEVLDAIRHHGPRLVREISGATNGLRLTGRPDLCFLVTKGDRVQTPLGEGVVLQVFQDRITVHRTGQDCTEFFHPSEVLVLRN